MNNLAATIARRSVTLVGGSGGLLPLSRKASVVYIGPDGILRRSLAASSMVLPSRINGLQQQALSIRCLLAIEWADVIVAAFTDASQAEFLAQFLRRSPARVIAISLGDPHDLEVLRPAAVRIAAYSSVPASQQAVVELLRGRLRPVGRLAVAIGEKSHQLAERGSR